jgi:hypothetical protein
MVFEHGVAPYGAMVPLHGAIACGAVVFDHRKKLSHLAILYCHPSQTSAPCCGAMVSEHSAAPYGAMVPLHGAVAYGAVAYGAVLFDQHQITMFLHYTSKITAKLNIINRGLQIKHKT